MFGGAVITPTAVAQSSAAGDILLGKFNLRPSLYSTMAYVDNVAYSNANEIDSWKLVTAPEAEIYTKLNDSLISVKYRLENGKHFSSSADDYTDHMLSGKSNIVINDRNRVTINAAYLAGHDERGRNYSNGRGSSLNSVDTFDRINGNAAYTYGALSSFGQVAFSIGYEDIDYDRREELYLIRDRSIYKADVEFKYKIAPTTNFVVDVGQSEIRYAYDSNPELPLDSSESRVLAGLDWDLNATSSSFAKIGYRKKSFKSPERNDFSGVTWEVGASWLPVTYSKFTIRTRQGVRETNTTGADFIESRDLSLDWQHFWVERFSTTMTGAYLVDEFQGMAEDLREDDTTRITMSGDYKFRRWLTLGIFFSKSVRDSNRELIEYDRNVYGLTAKVTL
ncbi:outer membrane beta-barrel protein [Alteromonas confluentis]|nr:outer membrane beta-barrel protein [Alteromonas confluentis]